MSLVDVQLSKEDFKSSGWEGLIQQSERKDCHDYSRLLLGKAREAKDAGDTKKEAVFRLLGQVASMMLRPGSIEEPFAPVAVWENSRSAIVSDLSDQELDLLAEIVSDIADPELRARVADVLWVRKRDFRCAQLAIDSYLKSATILEDPEHWPACEDRIQRALRLAASLGPKAGQFEKVVSYIKAVLDKYQGEDPLYLSDKLMRLLLEYKEGDGTKYSALSEKSAQRAEAKNNMSLARSCWETNAKWQKKSGNADKEQTAKIKAAETYVKEAKAALTSSNYMAASIHMQHAIEAYRRVGGQKRRVEELHGSLLAIQQNITTELKVVSTEVDVSAEIKKTLAKVKGKSLPQALISMALMARPVDVESLREQVKDNARQYPFQHLVEHTLVDEEGKVIARMPSMYSGDPKEVEDATYAAMFRDTQFHRIVCVDTIIEPVRRQINLEHNVRLQDLEFIVLNNPLIPEGREQIYARGFVAGQQGDFLVAAHLLIPQFENSIRCVLAQRGVPTSGINSEGIQEEFDLNKLLRMEETKEVFGKDITFDLRALLVERFGANLRNRMAHGMISQGGFNTADVVYFWWMMLHLCCLPLIIRAERQAAPSQSSSADAERIDDSGSGRT